MPVAVSDANPIPRCVIRNHGVEVTAMKNEGTHLQIVREVAPLLRNGRMET